MAYDEPQFYRLAERAASADRDVVDMVSGDPDWGPPPAVTDGLRRYADAVDADPSAAHYPPSEGLDELREAFAAERDVPSESVLLTNGTGEANHLALAAALERGAGDEVVVTAPTYPYYPAKVELLGGTVRRVHTGPAGDLDPAAVRDATGPDTAAVLLNTPNNPTGAVYDRETIAAVADAAADAGALLVSDETYERFVLDGGHHSALAVAADAGDRDAGGDGGETGERVVVTTSVSKSLAITGFRVGAAICPSAVYESARRRHLLSTVTGSRPAQAAVAHALAETGDEHYAAVRETLRDRRDRFVDGLRDAGATVRRPAGGFYVLASLPGWPGTMAAAERLIDEAGVAAMPGAAFGDGLEDWLRFALVTPRIDAAVERLRAVC